MVQIAFNSTLFAASIIGGCRYCFSHSDTDALLCWNIKKKVTGLLPHFVSGQRGFGSLIFIDKLITASKINKSAARDKVLDLIALGRFVNLINFLGVYCTVVDL